MLLNAVKNSAYAIIPAKFTLIFSNPERVILRHIYSLIFFLALPVILLRLFWRGRCAPDYFKRWGERFGISNSHAAHRPVIWVHAVSVGEVEACRPLVKGLQTHYPDHDLLITTMTPTGSARVKALFDDQVLHCYLPYDLPFAVKRFLKRYQPVMGILMETELWPNLIAHCSQQKIPLVMANARLSERSARGYARIAKLTREMFAGLTLIATQTQTDRQRFRKLGMPADRVHAVGNLKFELSLPASLSEQAEATRAMWGNRPVWIAASTHEGEEELILNATRRIRATVPDVLLILVPRHPERFDRVAALSRRSGYRTVRRSEGKPCSSAVEVLVVDTMGELPVFYGCSDVALIGGSLIPHGGHNLLEPAALGRAVITGPHYFNFAEVTRQFIAHGAAVEVADQTALADKVIELLGDPQQRAAMGEAGLDLIARNQGASKRLINLINRHIQHVSA